MKKKWLLSFLLLSIHYCLGVLIGVHGLTSSRMKKKHPPAPLSGAKLSIWFGFFHPLGVASCGASKGREKRFPIPAKGYRTPCLIALLLRSSYLPRYLLKASTLPFPFQRAALTFVAVVVAVGDAFPFPVHGPVVVAGDADRSIAAGGAAVRAGDALVPLLVAVVTVRARVQAAALVREPAGPAQDALALRRPVAGGTGRMAIGAAGKRNWASGRAVFLG